MNIAHIDIGGCEGCSVAIIRALKIFKNISVSRSIDIHFKNRIIARNEFKIENEDILIVSGAICLNDHEKVEMLKELRNRSKIIVAFGSCASLGGITRYCRGGQQPKPEHMTFQPINSIIKVDYAIPGCPPSPKIFKPFLEAFLDNRELLIFKAVANIKKLSGFDLMDDVVLQNICVGCGACILSCPNGALQMVSGKPDLIVEKCIRCGTCYIRCPKASQILIRRYSE